MILVDDRTGSKELLRLFPKGTAELARLDSADFCFLGNGPEAEPWMVGIERKKLPDLLGDLGRFTGHQLPSMQDEYQVVYLIIEGVWRRNFSSGLLDVARKGGWRPLSLGSRRFMHRELDGLLTTLTMAANVHIRQTSNSEDTASLIVNLYRWWTNKEFEEHRAHLTREPPSSTIRRPNLVERLAKELPGIGWKKAREAAAAFATPMALVLSSEEEWRQLPGVGKVLAARVVNALQGKKG